MNEVSSCNPEIDENLFYDKLSKLLEEHSEIDASIKVCALIQHAKIECCFDQTSFPVALGLLTWQLTDDLEEMFEEVQAIIKNEVDAETNEGK